MAVGDYLSKNKAAILYIKEILENYSSIEKPLSNANIRRILSDYPYNMDLHRDTVKEILVELNAYDEDLYCCNISEQKSTDGYSYSWYYNHSLSTYDSIKDIVKDIYYNPLLPSDQARDKAKELMSLIPSSYAVLAKKDIADLNTIPVKQNELSEEAYQIFQQIRQIIKDNRSNPRYETYIKFNIYTHAIKNKKHFLKKNFAHFHEVLPLAIVEWNYHYWMICIIELTKKLAHFRIDLMCDIEIIEKFKDKSPERKKLKDKVSTSDGLNKYLNEHIYMADSNIYEYIENEKVISATLKIRNNNNSDITYFYDIYKDNFKVLEEKEDYYLVQIRGTEKAIKNVVVNNIGLIELVRPEYLISNIYEEINNVVQRIHLNTNDVLLSPKKYRGHFTYPYKVDPKKSIYLIDFRSIRLSLNIKDLDDGTTKEEMNLYKYLKQIGFKKKRKTKRTAHHEFVMLESDKFNNVDEIVDLINEYKNKNKQISESIVNILVYQVIFDEEINKHKIKVVYSFNIGKQEIQHIPASSLSFYLGNYNK